jgi:3-isopropylmalate/(R)-2-methylmalate dehydratase large subunit
MSSARAGLSQPGITLVCGDFAHLDARRAGALAFGIGSSEVTTSWRRSACGSASPSRCASPSMARCIPHITGKDIILAIIGKIGAAGAVGYVMEYAGSAIRGLSMEGRLTLCNMSIEAGGRAGMVAPTTRPSTT